ncbi:hypothetical protein LJC13_00050 [Peptostreptococcaceae bacterium OttesenSCG-928-C18]|nr:hypothetical protein [Peptostreptococcaceae bacterium OttesenSCG-928-C18]
MNIILTKLSRIDAKSLFEFEIKNRKYFENFVPSRSKDYFKYDSFLNILDFLL